jgi:hypothetical protein
MSNKDQRDLGYLYVATGSKYIREATQSARTLRLRNPDANIALICNEKVENDLFDHHLLVGFEGIDETSWKANLVYKIEGMLHTPFEKTIFIDTDIYFVDAVDELFPLLSNFDILACLDYYDRSEVQKEGEVVPAYTPYNTGMLAFNRSEHVMAFLHDWKKYYQLNIDRYWSDQPAFMEALLYHPVKMYVLHSTYNFRFLFNLGFLEGEAVKLIHGRASEQDFEIIASRVNRSLAQRVWVASLRKCYSWEINGLSKMARRIYSFLPGFVHSFFRKT